MGFITRWRKDAAVEATEVVEDGPGVRASREQAPLSRYQALKIFILHSKFFRFAALGLICILCIVLATVLAVTQVAARKHSQKSSNITFHPIRPPSFPLAVRNPYLSAWIPSRLVEDLPSSLPQFWAGQDLLWGIMARVDGTAYNLMGAPRPGNGTISAVLQKAEFTATHTLFSFKTGGAIVTLDFFSPISPSNYLRQSLPFSYLTISATTTKQSSVQVYTDIDSSWTGQSTNTSWGISNSGNTSIFSLSAVGTFTYSENAIDQALWGEAILASRPSNSSTLTTQSGKLTEVRATFANSGKLAGTTTDWTDSRVVGMAHDLGSVSGISAATFAVGYVREEAINYLGTAYTGYYRASYPSTSGAVVHFLDDFEDAGQESLRMDMDLSSKATSVAGSNYSDIVALSLRQAYGAIDLTIPNATLNASSPLAFIKEISSDGNVNTVDVIFPAFPIYYSMDPEWIRLLLEPIMRYLASGRWTQKYVIHDIGARYPNATGHDNQVAEEMPVEETGNLLILAYAYHLAMPNETWTSQYMTLFQRYADYLVPSNNSLNISLQLSTNDAAGPLVNETNLAIKGALGLKAFGLLSGMSNYSTLGDTHANILYNQGLATDSNKTHFALTYPSQDTTWKVTFNLFPDILLNLSTFPSAAYAMQSDFYPTVRSPGGVALDNRQHWAKSDWNIWAAAASANETRDMFVDDIWTFIGNGMNDAPFSDRWIVRAGGEGGKPVGKEQFLRARPTVGGHFALLALQGARYLGW